MADFNSFNLGKEGVSMSVKAWKGDLNPFAKLDECWVLVKGIPPGWCVWEIFYQIASSYELLEEMDWQRIFSSFYEIVRMRIKYRDVAKIPKERLFCFIKSFTKLSLLLRRREIRELDRIMKVIQGWMAEIMRQGQL
jgi:hypothetical protein